MLLDEQELDNQNQIGSGTYSDVQRIEKEAESFALKKFNSNNGPSNLSLEYSVLEKLSKLNHNSSNINALKVHSINKNKNQCITEYCSYGDLLNIISKSKGLSELCCRFIFSDILKSYKILQELGYSHNDIKPENIVLDSNFRAKLIDFGFASSIENTCSKQVKGTFVQNSPELVRKEQHDTHKSDMQSLGLVMFVMLFNSHLQKEDEKSEILKRSVKARLSVKNKKKKVSKTCLSLLTKLLKENVDERLGINELFIINNEPIETDNHEEMIKEFRSQLYLDSEPTHEEFELYKNEMIKIISA